MYQLVTGQKPFTGDSLMSVLLQILEFEPKPIDEVAPDVPMSLRNIVTRLLQKQPENRYQSGGELVIDLKKALAELEAPPETTSGTKSETARVQPDRQSPGLVPVVAVLLMILLGAGAVFYHYLTEQQRLQDHGRSLAALLASGEQPETALLEDWGKAQSAIDAFMVRQSVPYLLIGDADGIVQASSDSGLLGTSYPESPVVGEGSMTIARDRPGQPRLYEFSEPILFQGNLVGRVFLALERDSLLTGTLIMAAWIVALIVAAVLAMLALSRRRVAVPEQPISTLKKALERVAAGEHSYRIDDKRSDAFGELYKAFNKLTEHLHASGPSRPNPSELSGMTVKMAAPQVSRRKPRQSAS